MAVAGNAGVALRAAVPSEERESQEPREEEPAAQDVLLRDSDRSQPRLDAALPPGVYGRFIGRHHSQMAREPAEDDRH